MGFITRFVFGAALGTAFIYTMDDFYYRTLKRNIADPAGEELAKTEVDVARVSKIVFRGMKQTYQELWP